MIDGVARPRSARRQASKASSRPVAQLAEHRSPKPGVGGSIPSWPARFREVENFELTNRELEGSRVTGRRCKDRRRADDIDTSEDAAGGRIERARLFLSEVRNELKRVTWPNQKEVYATTVVVILTSAFFGLYLFVLDYGLNSVVSWIFRKFGA